MKSNYKFRKSNPIEETSPLMSMLSEQIETENSIIHIPPFLKRGLEKDEKFKQILNSGNEEELMAYMFAPENLMKAIGASR